MEIGREGVEWKGGGGEVMVTLEVVAVNAKQKKMMRISSSIDWDRK